MRFYNSSGKPIGEAYVQSVNHRGYGDAPENTLPAYRMSWEKGFRYVECDVSLTSDGVPVLLHDDTINRTARNADGSELTETINIADITYEQALAYDFGIWKSKGYAGTKIPTFEEFIKLCRNLNLHPYIEIKDTATYSAEQIQNLLDIVKANNMGDNVTWISFTWGYINTINSLHPAARLGFVQWSLTEDGINNVASWREDGNESFIAVSLPLLDETVIPHAIEKGVPVECWNVTTEDQVIAANPYVSGFICDTIHAGKVLFDNAMSSN